MRKYLENSQEVKVVEKIKRGFLVRDIYMDDGIEHICGHTYLVKKVFDNIPILQFSKEIEELTKKINGLKKEHRELLEEVERKKEVADLKKEILKLKTEYKASLEEVENKKIENKEMFEKYKKYDALQYLEYILENKIPYFLIIRYNYIKIIEVKENDYKYKIRLALYGNNKGVLTWNDDTHNGELYPCLSYQEALDKLKNYIETNINKEPELRIIEAAKEYNLNISDDYIKKYNENENKRILEDISDYEYKINELRNQLQ